MPARAKFQALSSRGFVRWWLAIAIKLHTLLDLRGNIPTFIHISDGKVHEVNILDQLLPSPVLSTRARMESVTTRKRRLLWFFAIYGLSLSAFALLVMLTRVLLRWAF